MTKKSPLASSGAGNGLSPQSKRFIEAARSMAQFEHLDQYDPEREEPPNSVVIIERQKTMAAAGAQLVAFSHTNQFLVPLLRKLRMWPQHAGNNLILLSQMNSARAENKELRSNISAR